MPKRLTQCPTPIRAYAAYVNGRPDSLTIAGEVLQVVDEKLVAAWHSVTGKPMPYTSVVVRSK